MASIQSGTFTMVIMISIHCINFRCMRNILLFFILLFTLLGCRNYNVAYQIKNKYPRQYTGLDTLIRIDGYYFEECSYDICAPTIFQPDGSFYCIGMKYMGFKHFESTITNNKITANNQGYYTIRGDTIIVKEVFEYQSTCFDVYERYYIIIDSVTLHLVYSNTFEDYGIVRNELNLLYKFRPYNFNFKVGK